MTNSISSLAHHVDIKVTTAYLPGQSIPEEERFIFSYTITISNNSDESIKLLARSWQITDANGDVSTVEGPGVIGQTPNIAPAASFTYTSGSMFKTPVGTMEGHYQMRSKNGELLQVEVPVFRLAIPNILN
ncbi:MAG: ApaG protein [Colwellia sp.]|jgi:ApaG protein|tara:strand:- start:1234 stop:1626 length:393 start_codon:yes stop_codon:yes gene_type:complete